MGVTIKNSGYNQFTIDLGVKLTSGTAVVIGTRKDLDRIYSAIKNGIAIFKFKYGMFNAVTRSAYILTHDLYAPTEPMIRVSAYDTANGGNDVASSIKFTMDGTSCKALLDEETKS